MTNYNRLERPVNVYGECIFSVILTLNLKSTINIYRKDVRLPTQMQRAMAAEAEASREARAKVRYSGQATVASYPRNIFENQ